ncbi:hypothetical protein C810_05044 [Lachnospiraceae bacterium A2]|jgi:hypothetical protein|nr:hypothetical protein C810_05044 [Lachnospiraceae bacterium A2]
MKTAAQGIREMVGIASNKRFQKNRKEKHSGCLVVNCTGKGKMYLYDLIDF